MAPYIYACIGSILSGLLDSYEDLAKEVPPVIPDNSPEEEDLYDASPHLRPPRSSGTDHSVSISEILTAFALHSTLSNLRFGDMG